MQPKRKPNKENEEILLLEQWYSGDETAFSKLFETYYGLAIAYCISICKDRETSKDITQQTFTKIYQKVSNQSGQRIYNFRKYLFAALTKNALEYLRKKKNRITKLNQAKVIPLTDSTDDARIMKFMDEDVLACILSILNDNQQKVYIQQMQGFRIEEIAKTNDMTSSQVRGLLYRAREKLRKKEASIRRMIFGKENS